MAETRKKHVVSVAEAVLGKRFHCFIEERVSSLANFSKGPVTTFNHSMEAKTMISKLIIPFFFYFAVSNQRSIAYSKCKGK